MPSVMVLVGGVFGRCSSHENGTFMNGLVPYKKKKKKRLQRATYECPLPSCEDQWGDSYEPQWGPSPEDDRAATLILDLQPLELEQ